MDWQNRQMNIGKSYLKNLGFIECIFSGSKLFWGKNFAIDHFIPHAFVSWFNLEFNSIEKLPIQRKVIISLVDKHFDKFFDLQN
jgi:hypothetical protein